MSITAFNINRIKKSYIKYVPKNYLYNKYFKYEKNYIFLMK